MRDDEADVGCNRPDVGNMIANSFELQKDRSHGQSSQRNSDLSCAFNGLTESCAMGKTRIPGNALREKHSPMYGQLLKKLFGAFMRVKHAKLQIEDGLTCHREIEMAGLDGSGMNRSYRHLKDALAQSGPIDVALSLEGREHGLEWEVLAQRMNVRPVVMQRDSARIGVSYSFQAKPILDFALLPVDGRQLG